ncbi:class I SAM-dependent methyltransferase [Jongsikchunia kroppenstedtii]|uniref:class I SAM-dependent methyltransferase n=1 Tax=Jongsikchunia kroppenstedtii TaxID=1121721 RepID=UPI00039E8393|nr:class I SAM-dependent methyltransferase [Jongsikchunia kroppenstedtii]
MFRIEQDSNGILITNPKGYNAFTTVFFGGRRRHDRRVAAVSGAAKGQRVLDIASGPGALVAALADRVGPTGEVIGIDAACEMVDYATAHAGRRPNCRFQCGAAQDLDLPDASIDVVTCTFAMHHIPEDERDQALAEMWRVLRPGGRLLLADMAAIGAHSRLTKLLSRHMDPAEIDIRRYRDSLRAIGFQQIEYSTVKPATGVLTALRPA